jgi:N-acetylmuramoyl-L-alanine amidase
MLPAALRFALLASLCWAAAAWGQPEGRAAPTRPEGSGPPVPTRTAALPGIRLGPVEYVAMQDVATLVRMKTTWQEKERRLTLFDAGTRVEFEAGSREVSLNGLRLFLGMPALLHNGTFYVSRIDFERMLLAQLRPALLAAPPPRPRVIAIDPGHGGTDNGMENRKLGLKEKTLTLDVALRLQRLLVARGFKVVLTRTEDRQLAPDKPTDFQKRDEIANRAEADLLVSIHFNSLYPDTKTTGTESYVFTRQFQRSDRAWGALEKDDTEREVAPVNRYDPWSALLRENLQREVLGSLKTVDRGQKTMHSLVLKGLNCPAVLVESVFLSNDAEANRAAAETGRQQIAEAIARGIQAYADTVAALQPKPPAVPAVSPSSSHP